VQPVLYNRAGVVDIPVQTKDVAADIAIAQAWMPGALDESKIKRARAGKKFNE
jgi:hypothetical protein